MTWKERQLITVLSAILGVLAAILLVVLGIRYRENRAEVPVTAPIIPEANGELPQEQQGVYFSSLTYYNGSTTLNFSLDKAGRWIWSDDPAFPLDNTTVLAVLDVLTNWAPQEIRTDAASVQAADLNNPTATLTATTSEGTVVKLIFGKKVEDEDAHYVKVNNDISCVHVVPDTVYDLLCVPIYDMMVLPELPELAEPWLDFILIGDPENEEDAQNSVLFLAQKSAGDHPVVTWQYNGTTVTNKPRLRTLLNGLKTLTEIKCKIYRPSEEAASICGFDDPLLKVRFSSTRSGQTVTMRMVVGALVPDGSAYYVRLDDSSTIYQVPAAALDALLDLAENGLEPPEEPEA